MKIEEYVRSPVIGMIYDHYKAKRKNEHRPHLGGSQIGNECKRALWYQFRWMASPDFDGRMLRLFETGDREEDRVIENLRAIGLQVWSRDPDTGRQINFTEYGGHFALSLDGMLASMPEADKPHVLEIKTMNEKSWKATNNLGVQKTKPVYWAQCHVGMYLSKVDRACFVAVNKNTDQIYIERIAVDKEFAKALIEKAGEIIFADAPPAKLSDDPAWYECKFCSYRGVCHYGALPEVNCRTCAKAEPLPDGDWQCAEWDKRLSIDNQRTGCPKHLFNPYAMPWTYVDASNDFIEYETGDGEIVRNHENSIDLARAYTGKPD